MVKICQYEEALKSAILRDALKGYNLLHNPLLHHVYMMPRKYGLI